MEQQHSHASASPEPCAAPGCTGIVMERMHYYTGRFMAARDFTDEQAYFLTRSRLRNRLLHGWGIVCGLDVSHHPHKQSQPASDCAKRWVVVHAGMAIDCCGRELILQKDLYYELEHLKPPSGEQKPPAVQQGTTGAKQRFLLGIRYGEQYTECVPALYAEGACDPKKVEANRFGECPTPVEEDYTDRLRGKCWADPEGSTVPTHFDDCPKMTGPSVESCLELDCPCGDMVPLALIAYDPADLNAGFTIGLQGRRELPPSPDVLTHIVDFNWRHGGIMTMSELEQHNRELRVTFDRELLSPESDDYKAYVEKHPFGIGVNEHTFVVQCHTWQDNRYVPAVLFNDDPGESPEARGREAVFKIPAGLLTGWGTIAGAILYVTIKCDFILDCHGRPVDGEHLKGGLGRSRTGDGTPGGVFESWFRVVEDRGAGEAQRTPGHAQSGRSAQAVYRTGSREVAP